ncbi:cytochrome aa3 quinol oxidase subunit II [Aneurinibacillus migulanus]|uniref:Quinol oxidase subunit 2 n=1 Tax=Aneurinibacillus migulanus TaxID=47500 RepID=A0A0K2WJ08_ANEMI|nr:cytochrome aa3 quinol oxidase subunit II [Aneurinibacillus migulanus]GED14473.1 quinol oxidase subunit 2 [Aneurinibacillus migulanus]CEH31525.1 Cytochrome aa3 quinol oxidase, subunit II [Aneurinibacillus migulanus]CEH32436.1 Cytochrome aa3 quinol oxidase, subunit II [Aneurinibacillus migulanus]SDJ66235.1 cytochrome aa3-600 menaquinol oxidase subunit 2 [Aneurinibacillus migulanus]
MTKKGLVKLGAILPFLLLLLTGCTEKIDVLDPKGPVAQEQYNLILWSFALVSLVLIVVFVLFTIILIRYRERPDNMDYEPPDTHGNTKLEILWTLIPVIIVMALAIPTVQITYGLEKKPEQEPMKIQVVAADWKWIFKYPEQGIETVNYVNIPAGQPVNFQLDATANMNSFWVPKLGGQEYTMPGHTGYLVLQADKPGEYDGKSANFTGEGFAHMQFKVIAQTPEDFDKWSRETRATAPKLTDEKFQEIIKKGVLEERMTFSGTHDDSVIETVHQYRKKTGESNGHEKH